ncbi:hypothetical protein BDZ89DRAFT_1072147 [Hymenopellis radicata]|nr:hypothetical protein BDZ89DRAFT_1072147 [Hymenopellis radicata]
MHRKQRRDKQARPPTYYCDCETYCGGSLKKVSKTSYYDHKAHRSADSRAYYTRTEEEDVPGPAQRQNDSARIDREIPSTSGMRMSSPDSSHDAGMGQSPPRDSRPSSPMRQSPPRASRSSSPMRQSPSHSDDGPPRSPIDHRHESGEGDEEEALAEFSKIEDVRLAQEYIAALKSASLHNGDISPADLEVLLNPPITPLDIGGSDHDDKVLRASIRLFLAQIKASEESYKDSVAAFSELETEYDLLSYDQVQRRIGQLSGVKPIISHMCPNSCMAYTGPLSERDSCLRCGESRWKDTRKTVPRQKYYTLPLAPQIQAMKRCKRTAQEMEYLASESKKLLHELNTTGRIERVYDICCGTDFLERYDRGDISDDDTVAMISFDGAQLYRNKDSDCWIYIWIIVSFSPCRRYKKRYVIPGGVIPGPHKPKIVESFLFPGLHHVAAVNRMGGLPVWDAARASRRAIALYRSGIYIVLGTADGPGMIYLNGLVGHMGKNGCRLWCRIIGRHRYGAPHYYPVRLKPANYSVAGCDHDDVSFTDYQPIDASHYEHQLLFVQSSRNQTEYETRRRETGICKPSIFTGLGSNRILGVPNMFPGDIMHMILNLADLFMNLWRGKLDCSPTDSRSTWYWAVLHGDTWTKHGIDVARCTPYLPGSFDRPPRNPAEKINSGYKAWEYLLYLFALGPGLFYAVLPDDIWESYCRLVAGIRIMYGKSLSHAMILTAHGLLLQFSKEFETIYVQRRDDRMHFVRQSIHNLCHWAPEAFRIGPGACSSQWTMERSIGNLTEEISQHSTVYAHLSEVGLRRAEINALKFMIPSLDKGVREEGKIPRGGENLGGGYVLLRARDSTALDLAGAEAGALKTYLLQYHTALPSAWKARVVRWARLRLPNGQVARSLWKEGPKLLEHIRMSRNVKLPNLNGQLEFAEVQYYFQYEVSQNDGYRPLAMVSLYSRPDIDLLRKSSNTLWSCTHQGDQGVCVVDVKSIEAVVGMIPHSTHFLTGAENHVFVAEKPGLDVAEMGGAYEADNHDEDDD